MLLNDICGEVCRPIVYNDQLPIGERYFRDIRQTPIKPVNRGVFRRLLRNGERPGHTLDIDATQIVAAKREAHITYKGEKGYMPMVGHIAETGLVIGHEFREGNAAPAAGNREFLQACERNMPKGKKITAMRADSAAYQAAIFNYCEETGKVFAIGADRDAAVKRSPPFPKARGSRFRMEKSRRPSIA